MQIGLRKFNLCGSAEIWSAKWMIKDRIHAKKEPHNFKFEMTEVNLLQFESYTKK
jgi:hypothetical protein